MSSRNIDPNAAMVAKVLSNAVGKLFNESNQDVTLVIRDEPFIAQENESSVVENDEPSTSIGRSRSAKRPINAKQKGGDGPTAKRLKKDPALEPRPVTRRVGAHRAYLAASSAYFEAMFSTTDGGQSRFTEGKAAEVELTVPNAAAMELAIKFLYTGKDVTIDESGHNLGEASLLALLDVSSMLQFTFLQELCSSKLIKLIKPSNAVKLHNTAKAYNIKDLKDQAFVNILSKFTTLSKKDDIQIETMALLIRCWHRMKKPASDIYQLAVLQWAPSRNYLPQLLELIQLENMSGQLLVHAAKQCDDPLVDPAGVGSALIYKAMRTAMDRPPADQTIYPELDMTSTREVRVRIDDTEDTDELIDTSDSDY